MVNKILDQINNYNYNLDAFKEYSTVISRLFDFITLGNYNYNKNINKKFINKTSNTNISY